MASTLETVPPNEPQTGWTKSNPWGKPRTPIQPSSFASVMDEQLAKDLQEREEQLVTPICVKTITEDSTDTMDDLLMAQMLQLEYDREHDLLVAAQEKHHNKDSKIAISFEKFRSVHPALSEDDPHDDEALDSGDNEDVSPPASGHGGKKKRGRRSNESTPTKHDLYICGRRHVRNMEKFLEASGDIANEKDDYTLSNSVYNSLKRHSMKEQKYSHKLHEKKEHSTQEQTLDPKTRLILFKLVDGGVLEDVNGCINTGKEANVYHATGGSVEDKVIPANCAIKVFKTTLNEFKNREKYIKNDYRFHDNFNKLNPRKFIKLWAEKEMRNLIRMSRGGVNCPEVVILRKHVLVMGFIGTDHAPAPTLKEAKLSHSQLQSAYDQCIKGMKCMYQKCKLVHADLSEFNMMWHNEKVYFIDVSQAVEPTHPASTEFLLRDCRHVCDFFSRSGLTEAMTPHQLFTYITGIEVTSDCDEEFLRQVASYQSKEQLMLSKAEPQTYPFDYFFELSQIEDDNSPVTSSDEN
ncbi:serine/threonine-protein kinase RIO3-like [Dysidea avara]|uniref:serine/threonine-protein kinase RIO3-like n=1 Tax=Dysidea avara TaxID=196820 RepID=UPI003333E5C8